MTHDKYDNDILKQLKRIADNLEKIANKDSGVKIDMTKTLFDQGCPCCYTCSHYWRNECMDSFMSLPQDMARNQCCTNYEGDRND